MSLSGFAEGFNDSPRCSWVKHEERDTCIFLHMKHAAKDYQNVIIRNSDTNFAVIGISLKSQLPVQFAFLHWCWESKLHYWFGGSHFNSRLEGLYPPYWTPHFHRMLFYKPLLWGRKDRHLLWPLTVKSSLMPSQTLGKTEHFKTQHCLLPEKFMSISMAKCHHRMSVLPSTRCSACSLPEQSCHQFVILYTNTASGQITRLL